MSISKIRVRSAVARHNNQETTTTSSSNANNNKSFKASPPTTDATSTTTTTKSSLKTKQDKESPKVLQKQKSKIFPLSSTTITTNASAAKLSNKNAVTAAIVAGGTSLAAPAGASSTTMGYALTAMTTATATIGGGVVVSTTTTTTTIPQSTTNLLKIEPFVPSLATRLQKPIRRSYSTLSTTALKKRLHNVNTNLAVNLGIANNHNSKTPAVASIVQGTTIDTAANTHINSSSLPKVAKQPHQPPQTLRRRQPLRGPINRQRSKSTSSSNSASNRPNTSAATTATAASAAVVTNTTPTLGTPCTPPQNAVVIPQPNGICRIQRNVKEQEKLPDRINYDKRGLTAIPIFENEANLRLLSLQHNLINTFHIPKEEARVETKAETEVLLETHTNSNNTRPTELNLLPNTNNSHQQLPQGLSVNKSRFPLAHGSPNNEHPTSQLALHNLTNNHHLSSGGFGAYMMQRNKLLHRSINLNSVNLQQNGLTQPTTPLRFAMRKSKSFVNNFNLQFQINKRGLHNQRAAFLKKAELSPNLKSFDSSASNITTDSGSTFPSPDIEEETELKINDLEIKNKQLVINYGSIFQNLVFLDLYNNQIERIANLDGLTALTVLLLGKNRITDISGLASLRSTLRVLDLHGNKLCSIANKINCLRELKSLNLAGNQIRQINHNDFLGLCNLKELNLKRNKLKRINGFQHLSSLERLWLCHNDLHKVDDMSTIAKAINLIEVTIENNPVSLAGDCVSFLVSHLPQLQSLSQMPITEQVRKAAMTWRSNKELSDQSSQLGNKEAFNLIRREEIISNARTNWELLRSQQMLQQTHNNNKMKSNKHNNELEKITEANEQSYEEFIKLPPIEGAAAAHEADKDKGERTSSASSLGANVNSSSSCYTSADEDEVNKTKDGKETAKEGDESNHTTFDQSDKASSQNDSQTTNDSDSSRGGQAKNEHSSATSTARIATTTTSEQQNPNSTTAMQCYTPTLTIQFPLDIGNDSKLSNLSQYQNPNQTSLINGTIQSSSSPSRTTVGGTTATGTASTASTTSSSSPSPSSMLQQPGLLLSDRPLCKRYMTGSLMRSQTIVGTGAGGSNGYAIKANANTTASATASNINILRYHPKQSAANTTTTAQTTAALAHYQQQQQQTAMVTGTTMAPLATSPHHVMPSSVNGHLSSNSSTTSLNTNKTSSNATNSNSISVLPGCSVGGGGGGAGGTASTTSGKLTANEREREQGGDYLIEICGRYLNIYGQGALRFIDKQWNPTKANDVHTLNFSYINFNNITAILSRIKVRFPHAENFVFRETNINSLGQINALAELQGISSLFIDPEGNTITLKDLWRQYAIYRLSHWGLKTLNGSEVNPQEVDKANHIYAGLSDLILWSMPDAMLQPLLTRLRLDESCTASKMLPKQWLQKPDNRSLRLVVGKEALQWKKTPHHQQEAHILPTPQQIRLLQAQFYAGASDSNQPALLLSTTSLSSSSPLSPLPANATTSLSTSLSGVAAAVASISSSSAALTQRERGKIHFTVMMENTCNAVEKLHKLEHLWPMMLLNIVRNTLLDYSQLDVYIRDLMAEIMK